MLRIPFVALTDSFYFSFPLFFFSFLSPFLLQFAERVWRFPAAQEALQKAGWKEEGGCLVLPGITLWSTAATTGERERDLPSGSALRVKRSCVPSVDDHFIAT